MVLFSLLVFSILFNFFSVLFLPNNRSEFWSPFALSTVVYWMLVGISYTFGLIDSLKKLIE